MVIADYIKRKIWKRCMKKKGVVIAHNVDVANADIGDFVNLAHHSQVSNSSIGARTSIGRYTKIQYSKIGKYCSISWDVTIGALEHPLHAVSTHSFPYRKQFGLCAQDLQLSHKNAVIGNDVWIGCNAVVMPGICLGDGAVIGAGGVVTHNVEPYEIVAGCPAKHIGWRFSKEKRLELQDIKWWNWTDEKIRENMELFRPDINIDEDTDVLMKLQQISMQS